MMSGSLLFKTLAVPLATGLLSGALAYGTAMYSRGQKDQVVVETVAKVERNSKKVDDLTESVNSTKSTVERLDERTIQMLKAQDEILKELRRRR